MDQVKVTVEDLSVAIRGRRILDQVSFTVEGEVLGIAGPNGSGKSTLMREIETAAWSGRPHISFGGDGAALKPRVGYLPQRFSLPRNLTLKESVEYAAWIKGVSDVPGSAWKAIEAVHLSDQANRKVGRSSGGMVQRAGFASVLVDSPDVLLLDEPTTGVDIQQRDKMREIIAEQSRDRATIITSHIVEDLEQLCDRILVLVDGRVSFLGTVDEARIAARSESFADALLSLTGGSK